MISKYSAEVFGYVPKDMKRRMKRICQHHREWSESRLIKEGLLEVVPKIEAALGLDSPTYDDPHRLKRAS